MGRTASGDTDRAASAPLGAVIALSITIALGAALLVAALLWQVLPPTDLPEPFPDHRQDAETLIFLVTFGFLVPGGVLAASRASDRVVTAGRASSLSGAVAVLSAALALVVLGSRVVTGSGGIDRPWLLVAAMVLWFAAAAVLLWRTGLPTSDHARPEPAARGAWPWLVTGLLLLPLVLSFTGVESIGIGYLLAVGAFVAGTLILRDVVHVGSLPRRLGWMVDLSVVVALLLAVPNVVIYVAGGDASTHLQRSLTQFHQGFFLGPANQVLAGDVLLVDVLSQYGVGSIYFLAGAFQLLPIGYGTLGLIEGALSAAVFVAVFATLRIAGVSRTLAASAMAVGVVVAVYRLDYPLGALLQQGSFRFGLPAGVLLGAVAECRWPRYARLARGLQLVTVAVAAVWALEAFGHTLLTVFGVIAVRTALRTQGERRRAARGDVVQVGAACVVGHIALATATQLVSGELPQWGWYLRTLREFLFGSIGDWTFDFAPFSPGLAVGALYVASACALSLIIARRPAVARAHPALVVAIGGMTAYGVALYSYLVNRSAAHIVPSVCLPAIALGALWLELVDRPSLEVPAVGRRIAFGSAMAVAAVLVSVSWEPMGTRYEESALAHVVPGGPTLDAALDRIRTFPELKSTADEGERLLQTHMPEEERSIVLTDADLSIEILVRSGRGSEVPFGDPWEDSFVPEPHFERLERFLDTLVLGDRVLLDADGRLAFDAYRGHPSLDPFGPGDPAVPVPATLAPLQKWVLREIGQRFDLRTVERTADGLEVVELARQPATA